MPRTAALLLLVVTAACGRCAPDAPPPPPPEPPFIATHLLVTDPGEGVEVHHGAGRRWKLHRKLPAQARAVRVSPNGRHVAWVLDLVDAQGTPLSRGFLWKDGDEKHVSLGTMGFRKREAMGLSVADDGRVAYLDEQGVLQSRAPDGTITRLGEGIEPLFGAGGRFAWAPIGGGCLTTSPVKLHACGGLIQPLAWDGDQLAYTAEHFVFVGRGTEATPYPTLREPVTAGLHGDRLFVQRRVDTDAITMDVLEVVDAPGATPRRVHTAAVIVSAAWDIDGSLLVSTRAERRDLYELMLAHAPAEFAGELFSGEPVVVDPGTGTSRPAEGLPSRRVRQWRPLADTK